MTDLARRTVLGFGGGIAAAAVIPAAGASARPDGQGAGTLVFDPALPAARAAVEAARGHRLVALTGDPMRLWRDHLSDLAGPLHGLTRWSDYLILRSLAEERRQRVRREEAVATAGGPLLLRWTMA